ncbi:MAG: 50S ribosomal protein L9 [Commensalibacter sp.]
MSAIEVILLQRVEKLGQMGDVVKVKPGYARNFLLPKGKAIRATANNRERFERERSQLEAQNIKRREEAERLFERVQGLSVVIIRQAGESGSLYGSVTARDISDAVTKEGLSITRQQVEIHHPIKMLGLYQVSVQLHPEVHLNVTVNVARSAEESERQALGEVQKVEELKSIDEAKEKADLLEIEAVVAEEVIIKVPQE